MASPVIEPQPPPPKVAIIGAGVAGISAARVFLHHPAKPAVVVFEAGGDVGGVWTYNYSGFGLQVPSRLYEFPDMRNPYVADHEYPDGPTVQKYIADYAEKFDVTKRIEFNTVVVKLEPGGEGECGWLVTTKNNTTTTCGTTSSGNVDEEGATTTTTFFDYVLCCSGIYNQRNKVIPSYPIVSVSESKNTGIKMSTEIKIEPSCSTSTCDNTTIPSIVHSVDFTDSTIATGKNVLVVGYGKSAFDCAQAASRAGALSTSLVFRQAHWPVPRNILGFLPFEYATFSRIGSGLLRPRYPCSAAAGPSSSLFGKKSLGGISLGLLPSSSTPKVLGNIFRNFGSLLTQCWHRFCESLYKTVHDSKIGTWLLMNVWNKVIANVFALQMRFFNTGSLLRPRRSFTDDFWSGHGVLPRPDFFTDIHNGAIKPIRGEIKGLKPGKEVLVAELHDELTHDEDVSYTTIPCDLIILGTGFHQDWSFFPTEFQKTVDHDGLWLYRNMIHPDFPNLGFVGSNVTTFTNITNPGIQARWLAEMWFTEARSRDLLKEGTTTVGALAGEENGHQNTIVNLKVTTNPTQALPDREVMRDAIEQTKAWKRASMPYAGKARAYMIQTHHIHYFDELLTDLGISTYRKGNIFKEMFEPYRPRDYGDVVSGEYFEKLEPVMLLETTVAAAGEEVAAVKQAEVVVRVAEMLTEQVNKHQSELVEAEKIPLHKSKSSCADDFSRKCSLTSTAASRSTAVLSIFSADGDLLEEGTADAEPIASRTTESYADTTCAGA
ncbi:unnamed protein product [Amoebophrya sp. A120]|nr:unnamed protein product [Amoebophrya sp. A120]|eukprot:GSA120T00011565001.1